MIEKKVTRSGESRYEVRLRGADGKERSRTLRTKKDAERYERTQHTAMDQGLWVDPRGGRVILATWAAEWQRTVVHLRPSSQRIYEANLRLHILPELGEIELAKFTPSMLRGWLAGLATKVSRRGRPLAGGSVSQAYRTLNRVLSAAMENELIGRNPLRAVKAPRVDSEPMRFLSHNELATLAGAIDGRYRAFVLVAAYCGLRAGELMALRRKSVDLLRRVITVVEQVQRISGGHEVSSPKSSSGRRSVPLPALVAEALTEHLAVYTEPGADALVFPAPEGGFLRPENFRSRVWIPATKAAGVAPLRLHDLRHTCASLAIAAGADVKVLQRMLGHASAALTLDRYGHLMPGQARSVADRLDEMARRAIPAANATVTPIETAPA
ncbi:MAG: tyrosine-type recombinase/integrase, partial [Acidimicrobiia bacterium]